MAPQGIRERIWLIPDGLILKLDNLTIRATSDKLIVTGWTNTIHFENISRNTILQELADLKTNYFELAIRYNELNSIVENNNLTLEFCKLPIIGLYKSRLFN